MSTQSELDQRVAKLNQLLEDIELLLPSLFAHGLHIISQDPSLFKQQVNTCHSRLSQLTSEDHELGVKILSWFENNYPKEDISGGIPRHQIIRKTYRPVYDIYPKARSRGKSRKKPPWRSSVMGSYRPR